MHEILKGYVSVSVAAVLIMAVLMLFAPLYRERFSKRWQYYIWLVVVIRLLIPWNPANGLVGRLFLAVQEQMEPVSERMTGQNNTEQPAIKNSSVYKAMPQDKSLQNGVVSSEIKMEHNSDSSGAKIENNGISSCLKMLPQITEYLWMIWLFGVFFLFMRRIMLRQCFVSCLKAGCAPVEDIRRLEIFGKVIAKSGLTKTAGLYTNDTITSPLLIGCFRPTVVLTKAELSDADFYYTVLHEWTHYRRGDLIYKWLVQFTICLHWINPCVYLLEREVSRMCELSCDEAVTKDLGAAGKRAYGDMLLRAVASAGGFQRIPASITLHRGKKLMKERLGALMKERKNTKGTAVISALAALLLTAGAVAAGAYRMPAAAQEVRQDAEILRYKKDTSQKALMQEYKEWGITRKNGAYYYKGRRIRIFMDVRADASFVTFHFDKTGKIDVKLNRAKDLSVTGVSGMTKQETEEILEDYGDAVNEVKDEKSNDTKPKLAVSRLQKEELVQQVREAVKDCKDGTWYVITHQGIQYLYYYGMPGKYAFQPSIGQKKTVIKLADLGGTGERYVLLAVRGNQPLTVTYRGETVRYQTVEV